MAQSHTLLDLRIGRKPKMSHRQNGKGDARYAGVFINTRLVRLALYATEDQLTDIIAVMVRARNVLRHRRLSAAELELDEDAN